MANKMAQAMRDAVVPDHFESPGIVRDGQDPTQSSHSSFMKADIRQTLSQPGGKSGYAYRIVFSTRQQSIILAPSGLMRHLLRQMARQTSNSV